MSTTGNIIIIILTILIIVVAVVVIVIILRKRKADDCSSCTAGCCGNDACTKLWPCTTVCSGTCTCPNAPNSGTTFILTTENVWDTSAMPYICTGTLVAGACVLPDKDTGESVCSRDTNCLGYLTANVGDLTANGGVLPQPGAVRLVNTIPTTNTSTTSFAASRGFWKKAPNNNGVYETTLVDVWDYGDEFGCQGSLSGSGSGIFDVARCVVPDKYTAEVVCGQYNISGARRICVGYMTLPPNNPWHAQFPEFPNAAQLVFNDPSARNNCFAGALCPADENPGNNFPRGALFWQRTGN